MIDSVERIEHRRLLLEAGLFPPRRKPDLLADTDEQAGS
jgi:hypothetical protein